MLSPFIHQVSSLLSPFLNRRRGGSVVAFSPASLYSSGAQGIWLDPSDLTTMFSDRAGTTAVTTPGTVVGLRLDKSKGLVLGAELVTNGTFVADSNWTKDAGWAISGGVAVATAAAVSSELSQAITVVEGSWYQIEVTATITSGSICARLYQTGEYVQSPVLASGSNRFTLQSGASGSGSAFTNTIALAPLGAFTGSIDNISVRELPGNHAVAPTDAARPIYGVEPKGGRRNLLTWSEGFDNAAWGKGRAVVAFPSVLSDQTTSPTGTLTADQVSFPAVSTSGHYSIVFNNIGSVAAGTYIFSIYLRGSVGGEVIYLTLATGVPSASTRCALTTAWQRFDVTTTLGSSAASFYATFGVDLRDGTQAAQSAQTVFAWGAQLELGSTATAYQRVTNDYDVTEAGVQTCHYCRYDGNNNSMSTAAIDFTATDKMSVFAGVRKLGTAIGVIAELSANADTNAGVFSLASDVLAASQYFTKAVGSTVGGGYQSTASPYVSPHSAVTSSILDIAGSTLADKVTLRVNGTASTTRTQSGSGTGNFGNYPLFFGRRNNATLPFNGRDYGIIVVGKTASAGEIAAIESWLSDKTALVDIPKSISPNIYTRSGDTILDRFNSIIERRAL